MVMGGGPSVFNELLPFFSLQAFII
jgi:hypothetical protein